jgi:XTP/dITP diphosphohydrolase
VVAEPSPLRQPEVGEAEVGAWLLGAVEAARLAGVDPEQALRAAALRHRDAARAAEQAAGAARG